MSAKRDLQRMLDATIKQRDDALKKEAELRAFVKNLFYLHPPLKKAYFGPTNMLTSSSHAPRYEYVASLAEAERNVAILSSADLAKIDRYLEAVLMEDEAERTTDAQAVQAGVRRRHDCSGSEGLQRDATSIQGLAQDMKRAAESMAALTQTWRAVEA